jgi:hypothetical protein
MVFVVGLQEGTEAGLAQEQETFGDLLQVSLPGTVIHIQYRFLKTKF